MSTTRITDDDYADVALYDKVNTIADEIDNEVSQKANSSNTVTTNTEQTITAKKIFTDTIIRNAQRDSTVAPTNFTERIILQTNDSNGVLNTSLRTIYRTNGTIDTALYTGRGGINKAFIIRITSDGRCTMLGETPSDSASGVEMPTAAWVNTKLKNYVPLSGATITGELIRRIDMDVSQSPTTNIYLVPWSVDNADQSLRAYQQLAYFTGGIIQNSVGLRRSVNGTSVFNSIDLQIDKDGNKSVNVVTPPTTSNSTNIATTAFVKSVLSSNGNGLATLISNANGNAIKFTNGLIMQWGESQASGSKMTITLPTPFTSGDSYQVFTQFIDNTQSANPTYIQDQTATTFKWDRYGGISNFKISWLAIGF